MTMVNSTPVFFGTSPALIQNLGPGKLYVGPADVTTSTGVLIPSGSTVAFGYDRDGFYGISDDTADARLLRSGAGLGTSSSGGGGSTDSWWSGTQAEYDAIETKDPDTLYIITE